MASDYRKTDQLKELRTERGKLKRQLRAVKDSFSYRLGNMLVLAMRKPGRNTILLPYRLIRLCVMEFRKRKSMPARHADMRKTCSAASAAEQDGGTSVNASSEPARRPNSCAREDAAVTVNQGAPNQAHSGQNEFRIEEKLTEVRLADVQLSLETCTIMERDVDRWGIQPHGRSVIQFGKYSLDAWRRFEYVSSLLPDGMRILDVGCFNGAFLCRIGASQKFDCMVGVDIRKDQQALLLPGYSLNYIRASGATLPFKDKSFDAVTCMEVLEHLEKDVFVTAISDLRRVADRLLVITVPYNQRESTMTGTGHKLRFTDVDLLTYFPAATFVVLRKEGKGTPWVAIIERPWSTPTNEMPGGHL